MQKVPLSVLSAGGPRKPWPQLFTSRVDASCLHGQAQLGDAGVTVVTETALPLVG